MAKPFLAEIRMMSFGYAPQGWAECNGQLLLVAQNPELFAVLGTTFGGDGQVTFALPNLQERVPIHAGQGHTLGERGGEESHTLVAAELPTHSHAARATNAAASLNVPSGNLLAAVSSNLYITPTNLTSLAPSEIGAAGEDQAHSNMQPYLVVNFCIALQGSLPEPH